MIVRPTEMGAFHFVVLATRRAKQLMRGCIPHATGEHKKTTLAAIEIADGTVVGTVDGVGVASDPALR